MGLVMDIKVGNGAFMKTKRKALQLGKFIKKVGQAYGINVEILYSDMNQPLGRYAGLGCEVVEAINCMKGNGSKDLMENTFELCSCLLIQSGKARNKKESKQIFEKIINSGIGDDYFQRMISEQGGQLKKIEERNIPKFEKIIRSNKEGTIIYMDTEKIGWSLISLGCGKIKNSDILDYTAGIEFLVKPGDEIKIDSPVYRVFNSDSKKLFLASEMLPDTFKVKK